MQSWLALLPLAMPWLLAASQNIITGDATLNSTAIESGAKEAAVGAIDEPENSFDFLTIQQSYVAPEEATGADEGLLSVAQLRYHARLTEALAKTQVEKFGANWTLSDFCYKLHLHKPDDTQAETFFTLLGRSLTCTVISPLDCFVEGGFVHGPYPPLFLGKKVAQFGFATQSELDWASFDPENFWVLFKIVAIRTGNSKLKEGIENLLESFNERKVFHGWSDKLCLDPENPRCPVTAQNKDNGTAMINVGSILGSGCSGLIESVQNWEPKMFLGGLIQSSPGGPIVSAESMATTILMSNASNIYERISDHPGLKPGLDESEFSKEGVAGIAALLSEWRNKILGVLENIDQTNGLGNTLLEFAPNKEWLDGSKVHEKLAQAGSADAAAWESMFGEHELLEWIFSED